MLLLQVLFPRVLDVDLAEARYLVAAKELEILNTDHVDHTVSQEDVKKKAIIAEKG